MQQITSIAAELETAVRLRDADALSTEEFSEAKRLILTGTSPRHRGPSPALDNMAKTTLICGVLCIILGWTVFLPVTVVVLFALAADRASAEGVPTPVRATTGLWLAITSALPYGLIIFSSLVKSFR